jgi:hypothetical protein
MTIRPLLTRLLACALILAAVPAFAANRSVTISAPAEVKAGTSVQLTVAATTDAADGEQIGFLHCEYSVDGGKSWTGFCYEEKIGRTATRTLTLPAGAAGSKIIMRARVAFRGGKSGDVDFKGGPIDWPGSWEKWLTPPTKSQITYVR